MLPRGALPKKPPESATEVSAESPETEKHLPMVPAGAFLDFTGYEPRLPSGHQLFQAPGQALHRKLVHIHSVANHLDGLISVVILPHGLGDGVEPHHLLKAVMEPV